MNPDLVREMLAVINEVSQPIYLAARQKVLIYNWGGIIVCVPLFLASVLGIRFFVRKAMAEKFKVGNYWIEAALCFAVCAVFFLILYCNITSLLAFDYRVYCTIRTMLLGN